MQAELAGRYHRRPLDNFEPVHQFEYARHSTRAMDAKLSLMK